MKYSESFKWTLKRSLTLAIVATFAAACATPHALQPADARGASPFDTLAAKDAGVAAGSRNWQVFHRFSYPASSRSVFQDDDVVITRLAAHAANHPTDHIGLVGSNKERVDELRLAIIDAGVASDRITVVDFGTPGSRRDRRVTALVRR